MARPREFDEGAVLDAAVQCFWARGYESTSIKDLIERTGLTAASLYNAYGDKRAMFRIALDHYIEKSIGVRIRRCEALPPRDAIRSFFDDILRRSVTDRERKVLVLRFGLEDGHQRTLEEVGQEFGVTRERIRQIEAKALRKLRHPSRGKALKDYWTNE